MHYIIIKMLPTTYQYLAHLDNLNATMRDVNFPTPPNKPLDNVNNNEHIENMSNKNDLKEECENLTKISHSINSSKLQDTSPSLTSNLVPNMSPNQRNSISEINVGESREEINRETVLTNHHSIDLSVHSRSPSELNNCKENTSVQERLNLYKSKQIEKLNSNMMNIVSHIKPEQQKAISEKALLNLVPPLLPSQTSNTLSTIPFADAHNATYPPAINRFVRVYSL